MKDKLTIALPVYKRTDFVKSALDSAVKQTVPCSILLIDNNSPHDDFKKIVDSYEAGGERNQAHSSFLRPPTCFASSLSEDIVSSHNRTMR